jgi:uncharacterized zinc-type alcohol dehydrogenase-like protein
VVNEKFGIRIPDGYPLECAGPVMCAGVTMYEPMWVNNAKSGSRVGIVGRGLHSSTIQRMSRSVSTTH